VPTVRVGSVEIACYDVGRGDPVLLINGTGEAGQTWLPLVEPLADRWRFIAIDQRDTGASTYVDAPYTPRDLAADAIAVIEGLGVGPCHVAGFSLGGAVAQEIAIARPDLVRSLVLLSTWARSDGWFVSQMRQWQMLRAAHPDDEDAFLRAIDPWMFAPATFEHPQTYQRIHAMWAEAPGQRADGLHRQCDADIAHDARDRLGAVRAPALVLVGRDDICTPPRYALELVSLLADAEYVEIADAGHCALFEKPDEVRAAIEGFLRRVHASPRP